MNGGAWRFDGARLDRAVSRWREAHNPSDDQVEAFYDWAVGIVRAGPDLSKDTAPTANADEYVSWVEDARAFVTCEAVGQDRSVFVLSIETDWR